MVYDARGRLEEVQTDSVVTTVYAYDANGNRLSATTPADVTIGASDDQDRLTAYGTYDPHVVRISKLRYIPLSRL